MSIRHSQTQQLNPINANGRHEGLALASEISKLKIEIHNILLENIPLHYVNWL